MGTHYFASFKQTKQNKTHFDLYKDISFYIFVRTIKTMKKPKQQNITKQQHTNTSELKIQQSIK